MIDLRVKNPCTFLFTGPTKAGKTYRLFKFLEYANLIFDNPVCAEHVFYYYKIWTDIYDENKHLVSEWINECPTANMIKEKAEFYKAKGGCVVIIDDFGSELKRDIIPFFTVLSHNLKITGFLLTQNLFPDEKYAREVSRNVTHVLIFQNYRDKEQFIRFARQFAPGAGKSKYLLSVYETLLENYPYSYLWFDVDQTTSNFCRVKSNILPDEWPPILWQEKNKKYE